jgi:hypothetical protein
VCEHRDYKGKMTNVMARNKVHVAGDSSPLAKHPNARIDRQGS